MGWSSSTGWNKEGWSRITASGNAFNLIVNTNATEPVSGGTIVTSAIDTSGANLLIVAVTQVGANVIGTLTDSKGNTWTLQSSPLTAQTTGGYIRIYYCPSPTVGSGHTFTYANGGQLFGVVAVQAWSGANATPFDVQNGSGSAIGVTSLATGSVTPNNNNSLIVATINASNSTSSYAIDSGFTITDNVPPSANVVGLALAFLKQNTASAINPTWSWTTAGSAVAAIAVFKP